MGLWRRIVAVLAGSMIAAGGIVATLAVSELSATQSPGSVQQPHPASFDAEAARLAVTLDSDSFALWLDEVSQRGSPTADERLDAALGAKAVADIAYATRDGNATATLGFIPTGRAESLSQQAWNLSSGPGPLNVSDPAIDARLSAVAVLAYSTDRAAPAYSVDAPVAGFVEANGYADTPLNTSDARTAAQPLEFVALKAGAFLVDPLVANWTASAAARIALLRSEGLLAQDTLNLSLVSQAIRPSDPAGASAINAELRFRQAADGSVGGVRETAEAARALAMGSGSDLSAAASALNWLDARRALSAQESIYRMRAHAFDGRVAAASPPQPPVAASQSAGSFAFAGPTISSWEGKVALALWLLAGGIGLSLSLVTTDALKGARQRLYELIKGNPGLHVNELRRRLNMSPSAIEYHLAVLTGAGLVVAEDDGRYKRFYANGAGLGLNPRSPNSRNTLGALRRPHAAAIARFLIEREQGSSAREVARTLAIHESAVSRRLSHLEAAGLLVSERNGRERQYRVRDRVAASRALDAVDRPISAPLPAPAMAAEVPETSPPQVSAPASSN